jgi:hypothetical protein
VGGSAACIAEVLDTPGIEAAPSGPDDSTAFTADTRNPRPRGR